MSETETALPRLIAVAYLFDTDAISEFLRSRPLQRYLDWLKTIPRDAQFTSAVTVGELFKGAYRSAAKERHLDNLEKRVLPAVTILPALYHDLELITGNLRRFQRIPNLRLNHILADSRANP